MNFMITTDAFMYEVIINIYVMILKMYFIIFLCRGI